ncbi:hypothetical protein IAU60_001934 [Kwoniella sp. DSM 27419]
MSRSRSVVSWLPALGRAVPASTRPIAHRQPRLVRLASGSAAPGPATQARFTTRSTLRANLFKPTTLVLICVPILTGFLGIWQLKRLKWKLELIDEVDRNLQKPPMLLPATINFRRVLLRGQFAGPPILFGPQTKDGFPGYHLILPFVRPGGSTILVNRGFITTTRATAIRERRQAVPGLTVEGRSDGREYEVEGMLTRKGEKTIWSPDNRTDTNEWFWKDVEGMAEWATAVGGAEVQPVLVDAIEEPDSSYTMLMNQGVPVGRPPQVELRNQHAQLSLSASTTVMLAYLLTRGRAQPRARPRL